MKPETYRLPLIALSAGLFFISCRKDSPVPECKNTIEKIYVDESCRMLITKHDESYTIGTSSSSYADITVDVNHDQVNDLRIFTSVSGSYFYGYHPWTGIDGLHDSIFILGAPSMDTLYYYETVQHYGSNPVYTTVSHYKSCTPLAGTDSVFAIADEMCILASGDELRHSDNWLVGFGHYRWKPDYTIPGETGPPVNDTVTVHDSIYENSCHNALTGIPVYIGIKTGNGGNAKLGWLKLTVTGTGVTLHETAMQE